MPAAKKAKRGRKETQREIAVRRAEHFAISTPSGVVEGDLPTEGRVSGPFTIANEILSTAAANRQLREEAYALENQDELELITGKDRYEEKLKEVIREIRKGDNVEASLESTSSEKESRADGTPPKSPARRMTGPIDSLQDLCVRKLVSVFDLVDDLEGMHPETLARLAKALGKARKFDERAALLVAVPGTDSVYLPECSKLEEETILKAIGQVTGKNGSEDQAMMTEMETQTVPLRSLQLRNCGHSFNDKTAIALSEDVAALEVLELGGCYKLGDLALSKLLGGCKVLEELILSCDCRLGKTGIESIRGVHTLRSLSLLDCTHLTDSDILLFVGSQGSSSSSSSSSSSDAPKRHLPLLEHISLQGLVEVTEKSVVPLVEYFGPRLRGLNLCGCVLLGDGVLMQIRQSCARLEQLDLGEMGRATSAGLLGLFVLAPERHKGDESQAEEEDVEENVEEAGKKRRKIGGDLQGDDALEGVLSSAIGSLERISLKNVRNTTDETVQYLTESCRRLAHMNISGCSKLTSKSAVCIALNSKDTLRTLDVSFARGLQNEALTFLVNSCRNLESLTVWGCTQLDSFYDTHDNRQLLVVGRQ